MARRTRWKDLLVDSNVGSGAQAVLSITDPMSEDSLQGVTVTRLIGRLKLGSTTVAGAWGKQILDLGIGVASREASQYHDYTFALFFIS